MFSFHQGNVKWFHSIFIYIQIERTRTKWSLVFFHSFSCSFVILATIACQERKNAAISCELCNVSPKSFPSHCQCFFSLHFRIFPITIRALSRLDMFRCSILYCKYYAFMHHLHRSISVASLSDAFRSQQDSQASCVENLLRMAAVNCNELTAESDVFEGKR